MKKLFTSLQIVFLSTLLSFVTSGAIASTLNNNIALSSLGAVAFDNGNWVEQVSVPGFEYDAMLAIDDSVDGFTYWAGIGTLPQEQIWINFDKEYMIDAVYLEEWDIAYLTSATLDYLQDGSWFSLDVINKSTPDYLLTFSPIRADGVRLNVNSATVPAGWINRATALYSFEVRAVPVPTAALLFGSGLLGLIGFARKSYTSENVANSDN